MDQSQLCYAVLLLLMSLLVEMSECNCSRKYTSTQPDCSMARFSNGQFANTTIPCFVTTETAPVQQLEFPDHNTHTCYRTCIDPSNDYCVATRLANIHNRDLVVGSDFKLWVFSQGFLRTSNQKYRKSSICRYNVKCSEGQILSYSIDTHILEEPAICGGASDACIDSLTLDFPGMGSSQTSCGTRSATSTITDGSTELHIEFMANRANELNGFLMLAWCVEPRIRESPTQASSRRSVDSHYTGCTSPTPLWKRSSEWEETTNETALLKLASAFTEHSKKILDPLVTHITVDMFSHVRFNENTITITQHGDIPPREFTNITSFHLSNRMINNTVFNESAPGKYHGYGYIVLVEGQAFFLQDGANPEYRPTSEEQEMIDELQLGIKEVVLAKKIEQWKHPHKIETEFSASGDIWGLTDTARLYSTACNSLLRSVACAYLKLVHSEDSCDDPAATNTVH